MTRTGASASQISLYLPVRSITKGDMFFCSVWPTWSMSEHVDSWSESGTGLGTLLGDLPLRDLLVTVEKEGSSSWVSSSEVGETVLTRFMVVVRRF